MGGPSELSEVKNFLFRIFTDSDLIPLGSMQKWLGSLIAKLRTPKVLNYYKKIGGKSPIYRWSRLQAEEVCKILDKTCPKTAPHKPYIAFRYSDPLTESVLLEMLNNNITNAVAFTLYPQYSCSTTGSSLNELYNQIQRLNIHDQINWSVVDRWPTHDGLINAFKNNIIETLKTYPENDRNNVIILFTAHSLPMSIVNRGDPYPLEVAATVYAVMEKLNFSNPYRLVWQSQIGPSTWLGPQTNHVITGFTRMGKQNIILVPISFVSDHIETLFELDLKYIADAKKSGFNGVKRVESLNDNSTFIKGMADILKNHLTNGRKSSTQLELPCSSCMSLKCHSTKSFFNNFNSL
ncbi:ferrochelatase [Pneumocystis carinii B80]|uniref:Ferrochelatase n=1 Tax=Pneumocystis carinii (strain B80) TaxID=1408658 RepID=A0A0W4ZQB5_PNEC8|nr:ferrochelatase [Pneumocystis carinii B80]KTW30579.1 ferrochelatase [Pneumocystis carinii B80]